MAEQRPLDLETYFGGIEDPRVEKTKVTLERDIFLILNQFLSKYLTITFNRVSVNPSI